MQKYKGFERYLETKCYNEMFNAIKNYMWSHKNSLGLYSYVVLDMSYIELDDIHIRSVSFHKGEGRTVLLIGRKRKLPEHRCERWLSDF